MANIFLARITEGPMSGALQSITLEEWLAILRKNKSLPAEKKRRFIIDCIIENEKLDRMYIEVDQDTYREWHRANQAAYRNRIAMKQFHHISMDAEIEGDEGDTVRDIFLSYNSLERDVEFAMAFEELCTELKAWRPWALDLLTAYVNGNSKACTKKLAAKYHVSEQIIRKYKRQFKKFIKKFFAGVSF